MDVDSVVSELSRVREGSHRGKPSEGGGSELNSSEKTLDEVETVELGHLEGGGDAVTVNDVGEESWDGGGEEVLRELVVGEAESVTVSVSSSLFGGESVLSICDKRNEERDQPSTREKQRRKG